MVDAIPEQRMVPGAPPPAPISKSQKKKRKTAQKPKDDAPVAIPDLTAAALVEKAPEAVDIVKGTVAQEMVATAQETASETAAEKLKSPIVELFNKRIKLQTKKLSRIATYSSKPPSELNEDQKKSVASLPAIHAVVRELEELKKSVETLEAQETKRREDLHIEEEKTTNDRITQEVAVAAASSHRRVSELLSLLQLADALVAGDLTFSLAINEAERNAIFLLAQTVTGVDSLKKEECIAAFFSTSGEFDGVSHSRLLEVVETYHNPPPEPEPMPVAEELPKEVIESSSMEIQSTEQPQSAEESVPPLTGSFHFMQASELEGHEEDAELIERPQDLDVRAAEVQSTLNLNLADTGISLETDGIGPASEEPPATAISAALDWAADDAVDLPSINSLHAKFGTSGAVTPEALAQDAAPIDTNDTSLINGQVHVSEVRGASPEVDADGFVKAKSGRGKQTDFRGRGRGGFRGDKGGPRGGYRGRGGADSFGGGGRGDGGRGFRGERGRGDFRGGRGGEFRGRGRGNRGKNNAESHEQSS